MESPQCCCSNFYSMHYINRKPFILCMKYFKEATQNLSMNSVHEHQFIWSMATGLDFKASWYGGEDTAWMSDTYVVAEVPDDSQKEPQIQYCSGITSAPSPAQGWHRGRMTQVDCKDPEPAGLDGPCRHEEILTRNSVSDCHPPRLWCLDNIRSCL